jgi:hypothetical protein
MATPSYSTMGAVGGGAVGGAFGGPLGAGVGMAAGSMIGGLFDPEEPGAVAPAYVDPALYGTSEYDAYLREVQARQDAYDGRAAPSLDWGMANQDRQLALAARGYQDQAAQSYLDVLSGKAPSLAQMQLDQGRVAANASAGQLAASARGGPGNLLLAQQQAQRQGAANNLAANAAAAQLRAREMDLARQGLLGAGTQMRGQDLDMRGQSQQQVKMGADVQLAQTGLNDAMARSLEQGRLAAMGGQQNAQLAYANNALGAQTGVIGLNAQRQADAAQRQRDAQAGFMQQGGQLAAMGFEADKNKPPTTPAVPLAGGQQQGQAQGQEYDWDGYANITEKDPDPTDTGKKTPPNYGSSEWVRNPEDDRWP